MKIRKRIKRIRLWEAFPRATQKVSELSVGRATSDEHEARIAAHTERVQAELRRHVVDGQLVRKEVQPCQ